MLKRKFTDDKKTGSGKVVENCEQAVCEMPSDKSCNDSVHGTPYSCSSDQTCEKFSQPESKLGGCVIDGSSTIPVVTTTSSDAPSSIKPQSRCLEGNPVLSKINIYAPHNYSPNTWMPVTGWFQSCRYTYQ